MKLSKQQTFDICMAIVFVVIFLAVAAWVVVDSTDTPCKSVSPYANTLQHDIHRKIVCKGDK